jgi:hypothetical protein
VAASTGALCDAMKVSVIMNPRCRSDAAESSDDCTLGNEYLFELP